MILRMICAHIAVIAFALCASPAFAQEHSEATLSVLVRDQTGAVIPGARIMATAAGTGARFEATADGSGQAVLQMDQGNYELRVRARGFMDWEDRKVEVNAGTQRTVTMPINSLPECGPCVVVEGPEIPLEHQSLAAEIPLIPMQQFAPPAKPLRRKPRWL